MSGGKTGAAAEARSLLLKCYDGVLSTISVALPGYPFGSVVPFCLDRQGHPIILIADIAQHTRNALADSRVSLIVFDRAARDLQANGRLTLLADAERVEAADEDIPSRYYRYFPDARDYHLTHGFAFFKLRVKRLRFIGGFGAIHWLEPADVLPVNPFMMALEASMAEHMNADHVDAMRRYCHDLGLADVAQITPQFAGCDAEGFHLVVNDQVLRILFPQTVSSPQEVRAALAAMARR